MLEQFIDEFKYYKKVTKDNKKNQGYEYMKEKQ